MDTSTDRLRTVPASGSQGDQRNPILSPPGVPSTSARGISISQSQMVVQATFKPWGAALPFVTFDVYGHLFDDIGKHCVDMATIKAASRTAWMSIQQDATCGRIAECHQRRRVGFVNRWPTVQIPRPAPEFRPPAVTKISPNSLLPEGPRTLFAA